MKKIILISIFIALTACTFAQVKDFKQYNTYMSEGNELAAKKNYFDAYEKYRKAEFWAGNDQKCKNAAQNAMDKNIAAIKQQIKIADSLLIVADNMQRKVETVMFDKAVKERYK